MVEVRDQMVAGRRVVVVDIGGGWAHPYYASIDGREMLTPQCRRRKFASIRAAEAAARDHIAALIRRQVDAAHRLGSRKRVR
jgi:hypothetical protein